MSVFQFCLHGLSPGNCTIAIQPTEENYQYFNKKCILFIKSKLYFKNKKLKMYSLCKNNSI